MADLSHQKVHSTNREILLAVTARTFPMARMACVQDGDAAIVDIFRFG
ncbi:hypothetical protein ACGFXB_31865 [Streptomyces canus]